MKAVIIGGGIIGLCSAYYLQRSGWEVTLLEKGSLGAGVMYTNDCRAAYEELKSKGVTITEPKEQFYGTECVVKDGCGNWFSMTQPKEMPK